MIVCKSVPKARATVRMAARSTEEASLSLYRFSPEPELKQLLELALDLHHAAVGQPACHYHGDRKQPQKLHVLSHVC